MRLLVPVLIAATLTQAGCAPVCSDFCQALPSPGEYGVCSAADYGHGRTLKRVNIESFREDVAQVTFDHEKERNVIPMLAGQKGLVGFHDFKTPEHGLHVVSIVRVREKKPGCSSDDLIRIEFRWKQQDGQFRSTTADTDGTHTHAEQ